MTTTRGSRPGRPGERGFLLVGLVTMLTVMGILSGAVAEEWSVIEQREREQELLFIQEEFAAAILRYQEDQGHVPVKLDDLKQKGQKGQVFLRKLYTDPMARNAKFEDWCLLRLGAAGRVVSSCTKEGQPGNLGLGGSFKIGEQVSAPRPRLRGGGRLGAGITKGIVGVHSKSRARAFNTVRRGEETYDRWYYTVEDYRKEMGARAIPGLSQVQGPGLGGQQPGRPGQPGVGGRNPFGNSFSGGSSRFGTGGKRRRR